MGQEESNKINKNEKENNIKSNIPKNNYKYKINNENNSIKRSSQNLKLNANNISKNNINNNGYQEISLLFQQFQNKAENSINKIYEEINSIKKENDIIKGEIQNIKSLLENNNNNKSNNKNKIEDILINSINEKISNQTLEIRQLFESLRNQINIIQNNKNIDSNNKAIEHIAKNENKLKINEYENNDINNNKKVVKIKNIDTPKKNNDFRYLVLDDDLENTLSEMLNNSININKPIELNRNHTFELKIIEEKNQDIYNIITKQLSNYKKKDGDYMFKKAEFLKNIGFLVRLSHEISNFMISKLLNIFKEKIGFHSIDEETVRLNFACWIKKGMNENIFIKISKKQQILSQLNNLLEMNESKLFLDLFPKFIQLYFYCYFTDVEVKIIYVNEDTQFDWESMHDDLLSDSEVERKVLFTFLPGLYANNQYFKYSNIHVVTYKVDNPNKFPFQKPIFIDIQTKRNINLIKKINKIEVFYEKKMKKENGIVEVEFQVITEPDIKWDYPNYEFLLLDCEKDYKIKGLNCELYEVNYRRCICNIILNGKIIGKSNSFDLDLTKRSNKSILK